jgi:hypothetical protein
MEITLYKLGWLAVILELVLLLVWLYSVYGPGKGTDAAGKGLAMIYLLALSGYILISMMLMLFNNRYCTITVLILTLVPLSLVIIGLLRHFITRT